MRGKSVRVRDETRKLADNWQRQMGAHRLNTQQDTGDSDQGGADNYSGGEGRKGGSVKQDKNTQGQDYTMKQEMPDYAHVLKKLEWISM